MATRIKPGRKVLRSLALGMFFSAVTTPLALAEPPPAIDEAQIRAAMIFNLTRYVEWPASKFSEPSSPFVLCFFANDSVGDDTETLVRDRESRERVAQDRRVTVRRVESLASAANCHVLYASRFDRRKLIDASISMSKWGVLTISDNASAGGAVISLPMVDDRVQIVVDLKAAQQNGLTLSSKLLKIATVSR